MKKRQSAQDLFADGAGAPHDFSSRGLTLMELLVSVIILAAVIVGVVMLIDQATSSTKTSISAAYIKSVGEAANAYMRDNRGNALLAAATDTTPAVITIADLMGTGVPATGKNYLRGGKNTTPDGQTICVMVLKEAGTGNYQGLVVTEGGNNLDDLTLAGVISQVGGAGGGVYGANTSQVRGAMGGWVLTGASMTNFQKKNCAGGSITDIAAEATVLKSGHPAMALWFQDMTSGTAAAAATGGPTGKIENTTCSGALPVPPASPTAADTALNDRMAADANGLMLTCEAGVWQKTTAPSGGGVDPESGLPIGVCTHQGRVFSFKRVDGVVYGRAVIFHVGIGDTGWRPVPFSLDYADPSPSGYIVYSDPSRGYFRVKQVGATGHVYGIQFETAPQYFCLIYVP